MHNYAATYQNQLPPAAVCGRDGTPLLSWRVLILPYIGGDDLYKEFHLDEPWDSPHNLTLLPRMPATFAAPGSKRSKLPPNHTVCHVFTGPGTLFDGCRTQRIDEIPDGTSNTVLLVEGGKPVPWTKPEELIYDPSGPLPELTPIFRDCIRVGLADGSVSAPGLNVSEASWRKAIVINDGASLDW